MAVFPEAGMSSGIGNPEPPETILITGETIFWQAFVDCQSAPLHAKDFALPANDLKPNPVLRVLD